MSLNIYVAVLGYIFGASGNGLYRVYSNNGDFLFQLHGNGFFEVCPDCPELIANFYNSGTDLYTSSGTLIMSVGTLLQDTTEGSWLALNYDSASCLLSWFYISPSGEMGDTVTVGIRQKFTGGFPKLFCTGFFPSIVSYDGLRCIALAGSSFPSNSGCRIAAYSLDDGMLILDSIIPSALYLCYTSGSLFSFMLPNNMAAVYDLRGRQLVAPARFNEYTVMKNDFILYHESTGGSDSIAVYTPDGITIYQGTFPPATVSTRRRSFGNGLFPCRDRNDVFGYINESGDWSITPQFEDAGSFSSGLAEVVLDGEVGYIDTVGVIVINPQFENGSAFLDEYSVVKSDGRWYGIARDGELIGAGYHFISLEMYDLFGISDTRGYSVMNSRGEIVVPFSDERYIVN